MGVDMCTMGSAIGVTMAEDALLASAKAALADFAPGDYYRAPKVEQLMAADTLDTLFAAFRQLLVRDSTGAVIACAGNDDRLYEPEPLFNAVAHGLADGSWYLYEVDNSIGTTLLVVNDGAVSRVDIDTTHDAQLRTVEFVGPDDIDLHAVLELKAPAALLLPALTAETLRDAGARIQGLLPAS